MLTGLLCALMQVRPLLGFEKAKGSSECVEVPSTTVVQLPPRRGTSSDPFRFDFDRVYKMNNPGMSRQSYFSRVELKNAQQHWLVQWPCRWFLLCS